MRMEGEKPDAVITEKNTDFGVILWEDKKGEIRTPEFTGVNEDGRREA